MTLREVFQQWLSEQKLPPRTLSAKIATFLKRKAKPAKGFCIWCGGKVSGKKTWCGKGCANEWLVARHDPKALEELIFNRDKGVCKRCGIDTVGLRDKILKSKFEDIERLDRYANWVSGFPKNWKTLEDVFSLCGKMGKRLWEIHHSIPVCEGGGLCDPEHLHTLCVYCHRLETTRLQRKKRPR